MSTYKGIKGYNIPSVASDPSPLQTGQVWYNTTSATMKAYGTSVAAGSWAAGGTMNQIRYNSMAAGATSATALSFGGKYPSSPVGPTLVITESHNGSAWTELAVLNTKKELSILMVVQSLLKRTIEVLMNLHSKVLLTNQL